MPSSGVTGWARATRARGNPSELLCTNATLNFVLLRFYLLTDPSLHKVENYRAFLDVRRDALAKRMNDFIARKAGLA